MQDYELTLTVRNAPMLNAMRAAGMKTAADLSRASGVSQSTIGHMLALKITAYFIDKDGVPQPRASVQKVADALGVDPVDLYPESHFLDPLERNKFRAQVGKQQMEQLAHQATQDPMAVLIAMEEEEARSIPALIERSSLTRREASVILGVFGDGLTGKEVGDKFDISVERVRGVKANALRKIRSHMYKSKSDDELKELLHNMP